jgi:PAS domain S-box-containing protein
MGKSLRGLDIGSRIIQRLSALKYWKNGRPDVSRFARERGYLPQSLYLWIKNAAAPNLENLTRLSQDLGVSVEWLTFGPAQPTAVQAVGGNFRPSAARIDPGSVPGEEAPGPTATQPVDIGHVILHPAYASQLTERLETAIHALRETEARFRALLDQQLMGVSFVGQGQKITLVNPRFAAMLGREPGELIGKMLRDVIHPADADTTEGFDRKLLSGELSHYELETRYLRKDGSAVWARVFVSRIDQTGGEPYMLSLAEDITARKRVEEALRESEERARLIIDRAYDAFIGIDANGVITDWNRQAEVTFGWSRDDVIGRPLVETIIPAQYRDAHKRGLARFLATGEGPLVNKRIELTALHRDGHEFPVELSVSPVRWGDTYIFNSFVHDITERRRVETALRDSEERFRALFMDDLTANFMCSPDGRLELCNPAFVRLCGFPSMNEAVGADLTRLVDADTRRRLSHRLREVGRLQWGRGAITTLTGTVRHVIANIVAEYGVDRQIRSIKGYVLPRRGSPVDPWL